MDNTCDDLERGVIDTGIGAKCERTQDGRERRVIGAFPLMSKEELCHSSVGEG